MAGSSLPGYWIVIAQATPALVPSASVAVTEKEPEAVGVPVTAPVVVFSVSPAGSGAAGDVLATEKV